MRNFKFFKNVVCNVILGLVVVTVVAVGFAGGVIPVSNSIKPVSRGSSKTNVGFMIGVQGVPQNTAYIESMLNLFDQNDVTATFFVGGAWAAQNEDILKKIYSKGHGIGNHGYYDLDHKTLSQQRSGEEISITHALIKDILGINMTLFLPPSGSYSDATLTAAHALEYKTIIPTNDTMDLRDKDKTLIYSRAVKNIAGGALILMHPTFETIDALGDIIRNIQGKGFKITTVDKALAAEMI